MTPSTHSRLSRKLIPRPRLEVLMAAVATATFPLALLLPLFTFRPSAKDPLLEAVIDLLEPGVFDPQTHSLLGGIARLFGGGEHLVNCAIAMILVVFSVMFPLGKLGALWVAVALPGREGLPAVRWLEALGRWSMADVLLLAITVMAMKSLPLGSSFVIESGYWWFLSSVFTAMLATWRAQRRLTGLHGLTPDGKSTALLIRMTPDHRPPALLSEPVVRAIAPAEE